jgi:hypothetical protein
MSPSDALLFSATGFPKLMLLERSRRARPKGIHSN